MTSIRPMDRRDVARVAALYEAVMRSGSPQPAPAVEAWIERAVFGHPWADEEIPSLVATDDQDRIVGFLASYVRRLVVDGRPARLACSGHLVVEPQARNHAAGTILMRRYFMGPQDVTITDGATAVVRQIWQFLGGEVAWPQSIEWIRPLRPWAAAGAAWERHLERPLRRPPAMTAQALDRATVPAAR